jgi:hypothetical protein
MTPFNSRDLLWDVVDYVDYSSNLLRKIWKMAEVETPSCRAISQ